MTNNFVFFTRRYVTSLRSNAILIHDHIHIHIHNKDTVPKECLRVRWFENGECDKVEEEDVSKKKSKTVAVRENDDIYKF